jgi:hypothetical protein
VIAHPQELAADGREACPEWLRCGWPATGHGLVKLLTSRAGELLTIGLLIYRTPPGPGQPEWIAVTDLSAPPRQHPRPEPASMVPTPPSTGRRSSDGWPTLWRPKAQPDL